MKIDKLFMKKMLVIILVAFIIVPIIFMIFGINKSVKEGFYTFDKSEEKMGKVYNALDVSGMNVNVNGTTISGGVDDYMYCVFGDISCVPGYDLDIQKVTINGVEINKHQCISGGSHDPTKAVCNNGLFNNSSDNKAFYLLDDNNCLNYQNTKQYNFGSTEQHYGVVNESSADISGELTYFTNVYHNSLPFQLYDSTNNPNYTISAEIVNFNQPKNQSLFTGENKLSAENDVSYSTCFFENSFIECETKGNCPYTTLADDETTTSSEQVITCNANYGQKVGDPLCCGQTGVVQNDSRVCPYDLPTCSGYKCGETWGTCS